MCIVHVCTIQTSLCCYGAKHFPYCLTIASFARWLGRCWPSHLWETQRPNLRATSCPRRHGNNSLALSWLYLRFNYLDLRRCLGLPPWSRSCSRGRLIETECNINFLINESRWPAANCRRGWPHRDFFLYFPLLVNAMRNVQARSKCTHVLWYNVNIQYMAF